MSNEHEQALHQAVGLTPENKARVESVLNRKVIEYRRDMSAYDHGIVGIRLTNGDELYEMTHALRDGQSVEDGWSEFIDIWVRNVAIGNTKVPGWALAARRWTAEDLSKGARALYHGDHAGLHRSRELAQLVLDAVGDGPQDYGEPLSPLIGYDEAGEPIAQGRPVSFETQAVQDAYEPATHDGGGQTDGRVVHVVRELSNGTRVLGSRWLPWSESLENDEHDIPAGYALGECPMCKQEDSRDVIRGAVVENDVVPAFREGVVPGVRVKHFPYAGPDGSDSSGVTRDEFRSLLRSWRERAEQAEKERDKYADGMRDQRERANKAEQEIARLSERVGDSAYMVEAIARQTARADQFEGDAAGWRETVERLEHRLKSETERADKQITDQRYCIDEVVRALDKALGQTWPRGGKAEGVRMLAAERDKYQKRVHETESDRDQWKARAEQHALENRELAALNDERLEERTELYGKLERERERADRAEGLNGALLAERDEMLRNRIPELEAVRRAALESSPTVPPDWQPSPQHEYQKEALARQWRDERDKLRSDLLEAQRMRASAEVIYEKARREVDDLRNESERRGEELAKIHQDREALANALLVVDEAGGWPGRERVPSLRRLIEDRDKWKARCQDLESGATMEALRADIEDHVDANRRLSEALKQANVERDTIAERIGAEACRDVRECQRLMGEQGTAYAELKAERDGLGNSYDILIEETERLRGQRNEANAAVERLKAALAAAYTEANSELEHLRAERDHIARLFANESEFAGAKLKRANELEEQLKNMERDRDQCREEIAWLRNQHDDMDKAIGRLATREHVTLSADAVRAVIEHIEREKQLAPAVSPNFIPCSSVLANGLAGMPPTLADIGTRLVSAYGTKRVGE